MKRFSRYKFALDSLRPAATDADANPVSPDAPSGTALREVQLFLSKKKRINITRAAASLQGGIREVTLAPFGLAQVTANELLATMSDRAFAALGTVSLDATADLHYDAANIGRRLPGFKPAKVIVKNTGTATTSPRSGISGEEYKTKKGPTYTFPFGAGTTTDTKFEEEVKGKIATSIITGLPRASITFKPESFSRR